MRHGAKTHSAAAALGGWLCAAQLPLAPTVQAGLPYPVSVPMPGLPASSSAAGDSLALDLSSDGVFVLFSSQANNLTTNRLSAKYAQLYRACRTNGAVEMVSLNASGQGGGHGNSLSGKLSPNGRYVVFESEADDLVAHDGNGASDVFVRDMVNGTTVLVSVNRAGAGSGNGASDDATITPDGRFVAFVSAASDLVAGDDNGLADVFLRDLTTGKTTLLSLGARPGLDGASTRSSSPVISPDGRCVCYVSTAMNLSAGQGGGVAEVYARDRSVDWNRWISQGHSFLGAYHPVVSDDGVWVAYKAMTINGFAIVRCTSDNQQGTVLSTNAAGIYPSVADHYGPVMSADGRWVAFAEFGASSGSTVLRLWDAESKSLSFLSVTLTGQPPESGMCVNPTLTPDGRYAAFLSTATNLVAEPVNGECQVYVRDLQTGVTSLATVDLEGVGAGTAAGSVPCLSADGRFVLFDSRAGSLVSNDFNQASDVFVRDCTEGTTALISRATGSTPSTTGNAQSLLGERAIGQDGRYVVFESAASDLVPGDTNGFPDLFARDLDAGTNLLISVNQWGTGSGHGLSYGASFNGGGRYIAFTSDADDLVPNDTNQMLDVFVRDLHAASNILVTVPINTKTPTGPSFDASISADGRYVAFRSYAANLAPANSTVKTSIKVFVRDMVLGTTQIVAADDAYYSPPQLSPDGRYLAYHVRGASGTRLQLLDLLTGKDRVVGQRVLAKAFSRDNQKLAFVDFGLTNGLAYLVVADVVTGTNVAVRLGPDTNSPLRTVSVSEDGRWVAFSSRGPAVGPGTSGIENVYLCDVPNANLILASADRQGTGGGDADSSRPSLSSNGRYVAFRSAARNLTADDTLSLSQPFLFDRLTGRTTRLTPGAQTAGNDTGPTMNVALAPNAQRVVFTSLASGLAPDDWNRASDLFAVAIEPETPPPANLPIQVTGAVRAAGATVISWSATPGRAYCVQCRDSLETSAWRDLPGPVIVAGTSAWLTDSESSASPQRFYRVRTVE